MKPELNRHHFPMKIFFVFLNRVPPFFHPVYALFYTALIMVFQKIL